MPAISCPLGCTCGRHRRASCPVDCTCRKHLPAVDPDFAPRWTPYLTAFDAHLRADAAGDELHARTTRKLMSALLDGVAPTTSEGD